MKEDISQKSLVELKALAYDQIAAKELAESNLRTINSIIQQRFSTAQVVEMPEVDPVEEPAAPAEEPTPPSETVDQPPMDTPSEDQPAE